MFLEGIYNWTLNGHCSQMAKSSEAILVPLERAREVLQDKLFVVKYEKDLKEILLYVSWTSDVTFYGLVNSVHPQ